MLMPLNNVKRIAGHVFFSNKPRITTAILAAAINNVTLIGVQAPPAKPQLHGKMIHG
jgi:hypothetical protein